jgi:hypothetical protein
MHVKFQGKSVLVLQYNFLCMPTAGPKETVFSRYRKLCMFSSEPRDVKTKQPSRTTKIIYKFAVQISLFEHAYFL